MKFWLSTLTLIIDNAYKEFVGTVQVQANNIPPGAKITFKSNCGTDEESQTSICKKVPLGQSVEFTASISATRCLENPAMLSISPVGIDQVIQK